MVVLFVTLTLRDGEGGIALPARLAADLKRAGHNVSVYSTAKDDVSTALERDGISVITDIEELRSLQPEVIHSFHASATILARHLFPVAHLLQHLDGIAIPASEPPSVDAGISAFTFAFRNAV